MPWRFARQATEAGVWYHPQWSGSAPVVLFHTDPSIFIRSTTFKGLRPHRAVTTLLCWNRRLAISTTVFSRRCHHCIIPTYQAIIPICNGFCVRLNGLVRPPPHPTGAPAHADTRVAIAIKRNPLVTTVPRLNLCVVLARMAGHLVAEVRANKTEMSPGFLRPSLASLSSPE